MSLGRTWVTFVVCPMTAGTPRYQVLNGICTTPTAENFVMHSKRIGFGVNAVTLLTPVAVPLKYNISYGRSRTQVSPPKTDLDFKLQLSKNKKKRPY